MPLALAALLCIACGFLLVSLGWLCRAPRTDDLLLRASLSVGYGLGIFSLTFFLALVYGVTNLVAVDLVVFALLLVSFLLLRTRAATSAIVSSTRQEIHGPPLLHRILTSAFAVALCVAVYSAILRTLAHPHGDGWDAFAIWNLRARFLFRAGTHWRDGFGPLLSWSHPDYPLLLPGAIANFWIYLGHDDPAVPAIIGFLFTFCTVGILFSALSILRGRTAAMLGALALVTTPFFIEQGTSQYADVPLAFFVLATIALLCLHDYDSVNPFYSPLLHALAGLAAGFAAWTKNEGLLFLCAILAAYFLILVSSKILRDASPQPRQERPHDSWISFATLLAAVAPAFLLIAWFKLSIAPPGDLFSDPATTLHKLLDPARYWAVLKWYVKGFIRFGHWLPIPGTLVLLGFYWVASSREGEEPALGFRSSILALILTLAGYFAVYLITPYDIYWHLRFSLTRLFLQLWPSTIFLFFVSYPCGAKAPGRGR